MNAPIKSHPSQVWICCDNLGISWFESIRCVPSIYTQYRWERLKASVIQASFQVFGNVHICSDCCIREVTNGAISVASFCSSLIGISSSPDAFPGLRLGNYFSTQASLICKEPVDWYWGPCSFVFCISVCFWYFFFIRGQFHKITCILCPRSILRSKFIIKLIIAVILR
jgi:hypothetical protein